MRHILFLVIALLFTCRFTPAIAAEGTDNLDNNVAYQGCTAVAVVDLQHVDAGNCIAITVVDFESPNDVVSDDQVMHKCANCNKRITAGGLIEPAYAQYDATGSPGMLASDATDDSALQYTVLQLKTAGNAPPLRC